MRSHQIGGDIYPEGFLRDVQHKTQGGADAGVRPGVDILMAGRRDGQGLAEEYHL
jgi:hypothetical protein